MCYFKKNGIFIVFSYTCVISRKNWIFYPDVKGKVDTNGLN